LSSLTLAVSDYPSNNTGLLIVVVTAAAPVPVVVDPNTILCLKANIHPFPSFGLSNGIK